MRQVEEEITQISWEQKQILMRLRIKAEQYLIEHEDVQNPNLREELYRAVGVKLTANNACFVNTAEPIRVTRRLTERELRAKYGLDTPIAVEITDDAEKMEISVDPHDIAANHIIEQQQQRQRQQQQQQQQSLLKPIPERLIQNINNKYTTAQQKPLTILFGVRNSNSLHQKQQHSNQLTALPSVSAVIQTVKNNVPLNEYIKPTPTPCVALNNGRLNLIQALRKAKDQNQAATVEAVQNVPPNTRRNSKRQRSETPSPPPPDSSDDTSSSVASVPPVAIVPVAKVIRKRKADIHSSNGRVGRISKSPSPASSSSTSCELSYEDEKPPILGKEPFLRLFGLVSHTYYAHLMTRITSRKRRTCQSTEKGDFHYGKFDIINDVSIQKKKD